MKHFRKIQSIKSIYWSSRCTFIGTSGAVDGLLLEITWKVGAMYLYILTIF